MLTIGFYFDSNSQNRLFSTQDRIYTIRDTISDISTEKYYVVNKSEFNSSDMITIRRLSNDRLIVKGDPLHPPNVGIFYKITNNSWKLSYWLSSDSISNYKMEVYSIKFSQGADLDFVNQIQEINILREITNARILIIETNFDTVLNELIDNSAIEYIDIATRSPLEETPLRQYNPDINRISKAKHRYPTLLGEGISISIKENSIDQGDIDLLGKVTIDVNSSSESTQHAKEMGTLIAGLGNSHKTGEGVAINSSLVCTDFSSLFAEDNSYYNQHGITVQNHSYGTGIENFYGNESISYDQIAIDNPTLVHVFSAGNAGSAPPEFGTYAGLEGYANLTGDFKQAKNVLVIAAIDSTLTHEELTSSGPAYDGRVKPELAAFGGEGTSESAALVSGSVAMLQKHFENKTRSIPTSTMVKSLLIAGANEAHTKGLDFKTGYGSVNLNKSLQLIDSQNYVESSINPNDTYTHQLNLPADVSELKVVVSWIDPPANPEDVTALINDLDMVITAPDNSQWLPWVLNHSPNIADLSALPIRKEDHLNNVEMTTIENPTEGLYDIAINSNQVTGVSQGFSIAYSVKLKDTFGWSFPTSSDHLEAATTPYFRWENTFGNQTGELSIKYGSGFWELISTANLEDEYFKYSLKDTTITAALKMSVSGVDYISNIFSITQNQQVSVENECENNFILGWGELENTDSYTLYELQSNNKLSPILTTVDTLATLDKSVYTGNYYAIKPTQTGGIDGLKSFTINAENKNAGCYLTSFLAFLDVDGIGNIRLSLNVPFQIDEVIINKEFEQSSEVFQQFSPGNQSDFIFEERDLTPGIYYYSTELKINSGETIYSDTLSMFYTDDNTVIAFPNPVEDNFVNILNSYPGGIFQLLDTKGSVIKNYDLVNIVEPIELTGLEKGVYLFRIIYEDKVVNAGRIVRL